MSDQRPSPAEWSTRYEGAAGAWESVSLLASPDQWLEAFFDAENEYLRLLQNEEWVSGGASLLGRLGLTRSEVNHSTILGWLLDPTGGHRLGSVVLRDFLALVDVPVEHCDLALTRVTCELPTVDPATGGNGSIDVVVDVPDGPRVVIEVKLWSPETNDQLDRYAAAHQGADLVYLTPFGDLPRRSTVSIGDWTCISWREGVLPMLTARSDHLRREGRSCPALDEYIVALSEELSP